MMQCDATHRPLSVHYERTARRGTRNGMSHPSKRKRGRGGVGMGDGKKEEGEGGRDGVYIANMHLMIVLTPARSAG